MSRPGSYDNPHELKTWTTSYWAVVAGIKGYELRKNDRDFHVGDHLWLREWDPDSEAYTGRSCMVEVLYMTHGGEWGLPEGICVMSIGRRSRTIEP